MYWVVRSRLLESLSLRIVVTYPRTQPKGQQRRDCNAEYLIRLHTRTAVILLPDNFDLSYSAPLGRLVRHSEVAPLTFFGVRLWFGVI